MITDKLLSDGGQAGMLTPSLLTLLVKLSTIVLKVELDAHAILACLHSAT